MKTSVYVAVDIGATGMKMVAASCENGKLEVLDTISEKNPPLVKEDGEYADVKHMLETIHRGLCRFQKYYHCISLGIDTYGNGYGILDEQGRAADAAASLQGSANRPYYGPGTRAFHGQGTV